MCVCFLKSCCLIFFPPFAAVSAPSCVPRQALFQTDLCFPASQQRPCLVATQGWGKEFCLSPDIVDVRKGSWHWCSEAEAEVPNKEDTPACTWWLLECFLHYNCCPGIPARDLSMFLQQTRKQPRAKLWASKAHSIHVSMVIRTPRDLTAVCATGWEVLPGSHMQLGKCIQYSSTSGTLGCQWNVGKHCDMVDKRVLGLCVPRPSFQLIGKISWKGGVLERKNLVKQLKSNFGMLFIYLQKHMSLVRAFYYKTIVWELGIIYWN